MSSSATHSGAGAGSSSQGEIALFSNLTRDDPSEIPAGVGGLAPPRHRVPVFELQPWEPDDASIPARFDGRILESCSYCKNEIGRKENVFMYGCMQAFCSTLCRAQQILLDGFMNLEDLVDSFFEDAQTKKKGP